MQIDRSSLFYGASILTVSNIVSQMLGFIYRVMLSRLISTEELGLYQIILPIYSVAMALCVSGLTVAVSRLSSDYTALGDRGAVSRLVKRCIHIFFVMVLLFGASVIIFSNQISTDLLSDGRTRLALMFLMPVVLLTGIENIYKNHFYGISYIVPPAITEIIEMFVRMTAVLGILLLFKTDSPEWTVASIVVGMIFCEIFSSAALFGIYRRRQRRLPPASLRADPALNRKIAAIAVPIAVTNVLGTLLSSANAIMIPARLTVAGWERAQAMSAFGVLFGMTLPMLTLPMVLIVGLGLVMVPKLSESVTVGDMRAVRRKIAKAMLAVCTLSMPITAFFLPLGGPLGTLIFNNPAAGNYIVPLSVCVTLSAVQGILGTVLNGIGKQRLAAVNFLIGGSVQLACTWFLTATKGIEMYGLIVGLLAGTTITLVLNLICTVRHTGLEIRWVSWFVIPAVSAGATGLAVQAMFDFFSARGPQLAAVLFSLVFGMVIYAFLLYIQGLRISALIRLGGKG